MLKSISPFHSMKILFTADWHIKLGQKNVPVDWQKNRYRLLFSQLNDLIDAHKPDLMIIGGDLFDRMPSVDELALYFEFLARLRNIELIIYSGNHEAVKKNTTFLSSLKEVTTKLHNKSCIVDDFYSINNVDFIPYNKLKQYHPGDIDFHGDILCTHVRGEIPPHVIPEVPLELFDRWKIVLAGDLHSYENCQRNILYPGSPLTTSFHRIRTKTGVILIDTESLEYSWIELKLPQLIKCTVSDPKLMVPTDFDHTIYEIEGNIGELSKVGDSELLAKKVVKRERTGTLDLTAGMTLQDEVAKYCTGVLKLPAELQQRLIKKLNDYANPS